jgi:asparagine synthase (glutamine-hydrolysing)
MDFKLLLTDYRSSWAHYESERCAVHIQGSPIFEGQALSCEQPLLQALHNIDLDDSRGVDQLVSRIDGFFNIIVATKNRLLIVKDRINSYPLLYCQHHELHVSDSAEELARSCSLSDQNNDSVVEYLFGGFVIGENTLLSDLKQFKAGHYYLFYTNTGTLSYHQYFKYFPSDTRQGTQKDSAELTEDFKSVLFSSFNRLGRYVAAKGLVPVVPLSGGMDSRLIAIMLREVGVGNAICYTFGDRAHEEVKHSQKVAQQLGFTWLFCPYSVSMWNRLYASDEMAHYLRFTNSYAARPHIMELPAVRELFPKAQQYLFLPGHTLDFISGGHIPKQAFLPYVAMDKNTLISFILGKQYSSFYLRNREREVLSGRLSSYASKARYDTIEQLIADFENWDWSERQAKFIISALDVYNYFGHAWHMPFWEREFIEFFFKIPYKWNLNRHLVKVILHSLFPRYYEKPTDNTFTTSRNIRAKLMVDSLMKRAMPRCVETAVRRTLFRAFGKKAGVYDYGLNMHGCFEPDEQTMNDFLSNLRRHHDIRSLHYVFHLSFLQRLGIQLHHLHRSYRVL